MTSWKNVYSTLNWLPMTWRKLSREFDWINLDLILWKKNWVLRGTPLFAAMQRWIQRWILITMTLIRARFVFIEKGEKEYLPFFFIQINFFLPQESESMEELDISGTKRDKCTYFKNLFISYRLLQFLILKSVYNKVYKVKNIFRTESRLQCYTRSITLERIWHHCLHYFCE